jgi:NAD(P)-dependent dehydrogenase (short-subunit alcohol dehydrogenase family)
MSAFSGFRLDGKVAIVTGASSGIGLAIARAMADAGAKLVATARDEGRLRQATDGFEDARAVAVDLADGAAADRIVSEAVAAFGGIDSIVHSAGIFWPKPLSDAPLEDFDMQWRVNVRAPYALTKAALPYLGRDSSVIFVSSIAGHVAFPNSAAYCATKGAVEQLTKALAVELSPQGIRVNAIAPGNIRTPMNEELLKDPDYEQMYLDGTPYGRVGEVEDIAPLAVFLASDAARYIHGESILVDGGWAAR